MTNIDTRNTNIWPLTHKYMTSNTQINDHQHRNTWPLNFLAWYRHFIKKVLGFNLLMTAYLFYCEVKYFAETVLYWQFALDMFYCTCTGKWAVMYLCVRYFNFVSFYWILELFRQCDICNLSFHNHIYHKHQSIKRSKTLFINCEFVHLSDKFISLKCITIGKLDI